MLDKSGNKKCQDNYNKCDNSLTKELLSLNVNKKDIEFYIQRVQKLIKINCNFCFGKVALSPEVSKTLSKKDSAEVRKRFCNDKYLKSLDLKETNMQIIKIIKEKYNGNVDEYMDKEGKKAIKKQLLNVFNQ